jgi:hypothetical protein
MMFVPGEPAQEGELPSPYDSIRVLVKHDGLFAWLHEHFQLFWTEQKCNNPLDGASRTPVKRTEIYDHMIHTLTPYYLSAEVLPHHPPAERTWYAPCKLPNTDQSILWEMAERMNWDTEKDKCLMLAAILTMFWGGPCGGRPAFVFQSRYGAGSGKTTSAELIASVAGGQTMLNHSETIDDLNKRLLGDNELMKRCVLFDNIKSRTDIAGLESSITAKEISGHKMYLGSASRPNRFTWFLTANYPQLSHDLADRSIPINVGCQKADDSFRSSFEKWIQANRPRIVAACINMLAGPDKCQIEPQNRDRWAEWQSAVLQKFENGNELAAEIKARRHEMDSDQHDAEEIANAIKSVIGIAGRRPDYEKVFFSRRALATLVQMLHGEDDRMGRRQTISYINNRLGTGALERLTQHRSRAGRGYVWTGIYCEEHEVSCTLQDLPPAVTVETLSGSGGDPFD